MDTGRNWKLRNPAPNLLIMQLHRVQCRSNSLWLHLRTVAAHLAGMVVKQVRRPRRQCGCPQCWPCMHLRLHDVQEAAVGCHTRRLVRWRQYHNPAEAPHLTATTERLPTIRGQREQQEQAVLTYVGQSCLRSKKRCLFSQWRARSRRIFKFICMSYKGAIVLEYEIDKLSNNCGLPLLCNCPVSACDDVTDVRLEACWSPCQRYHRRGLLDPFGSKGSAWSDPAPVHID